MKPFSEESKQLKTAGKITQPFAVKSSMDSYVKNDVFPKPNTFAQKRKVAQVEPFKVFNEDQPLDLSVKKKKIVIENTKMSEDTLYSETKDDVLKCKFFFCLKKKYLLKNLYVKKVEAKHNTFC